MTGMGIADEQGRGTEASENDLTALREQLGRRPRGIVGIAARCACGRPLVVRTAPRLEDGTPFPTLYYLTHPRAVAAIGTLEASGIMAEWSDEIATDADLAARYRLAHEAYLADRGLEGDVPEIAGISAGGMPERVKCLHALVGHSLGAGLGVNPIGDRALDAVAATWSPLVCRC